MTYFTVNPKHARWGISGIVTIRVTDAVKPLQDEHQREPKIRTWILRLQRQRVQVSINDINVRVIRAEKSGNEGDRN